MKAKGEKGTVSSAHHHSEDRDMRPQGCPLDCEMESMAETRADVLVELGTQKPHWSGLAGCMGG